MVFTGGHPTNSLYWEWPTLFKEGKLCLCLISMHLWQGEAHHADFLLSTFVFPFGSILFVCRGWECKDISDSPNCMQPHPLSLFLPSSVFSGLMPLTRRSGLTCWWTHGFCFWNISKSVNFLYRLSVNTHNHIWVCQGHNLMKWKICSFSKLKLL